MILIVGATRNIGRHLVPLLQQVGVPIRALSRDAKRAATILPIGTNIMQADLTSAEDVIAALAGVERVFSLQMAAIK